MKKLLFICFLLLSATAFSRSEKIILVDYSYILDNYYKTQKYNKTLHKVREALEKKYNVDFNDKNMNAEKEKALKAYKNLKTKFTNEVTMDINIAIAFTGQSENYDFILEKEVLHYGKGKDISKFVLKFLNDVYFHELTIKNEKKLKTDIFPAV